jgi:hypothetical protein
MKGYQLIEHDTILSELLVSNEVIIGISYWFVSLLREDVDLKHLPIEIDVIRANYHGRYPCIGIHYLEPINNVQEIVFRKLEQYYSDLQFAAFYDYIKKNHVLINKSIEYFKTE